MVRRLEAREDGMVAIGKNEATRRVEDIMSRDVLTLSADMNLGEAVALLSDRQITGAPVCASDGRVIGVLSTSDLVEAWGAASSSLVGGVMTPNVLFVRAADAIHEAAETMAFEGVHRLVVLEGDRLVGVVTSMDVLRELAGYTRERERVLAMAPPDDGPSAPSSS
jgi:CBS domain-containing protein